MKFAFVAQQVAFPVNTVCRVLGVTRSGYYAWKNRPKPAREKADAQLAATVASVHKRSRKTYGSPRVHAELQARGMRRKHGSPRPCACAATAQPFTSRGVLVVTS
jgi:hypothetical protein